MKTNLYEYYRKFSDADMEIVYAGPLWAGGIEALAEVVKRRLALDNLPLEKSQAVFSVFIEQINNSLMYSTEESIYQNKAGHISCAAFALGREEDAYYVHSGNVMKNEDVAHLSKHVDHLNAMDKKQLRRYYKERIRSADDSSSSGGAGLGLIEIARRASYKIEYDFTPIDECNSFFSMFVEIG